MSAGLPSRTTPSPGLRAAMPTTRTQMVLVSLASLASLVSERPRCRVEGGSSQEREVLQERDSGSLRCRSRQSKSWLL